MQRSMTFASALFCCFHGALSVDPGIVRRARHDGQATENYRPREVSARHDSDQRAVFMTPSAVAAATAPVAAKAAFTSATQAPATMSAPAPPITATCPAGFACGTYITGFWDCCQPACAAPGKGLATGPAQSCNKAGFRVSLEQTVNVCDAGSDTQTSDRVLAGACPSWQPWVDPTDSSKSYGFAKVMGGTGPNLIGDTNCGQCYELHFAAGQSTIDPHTGGASGGAHPDLINQSMRMIVQVIGVEAGSGANSFQLYIPSGGGCGASCPATSG